MSTTKQPKKTAHTAASLRNLAEAGDYRELWRALLAALPRCTYGCGRPALFMTTFSSEFSCGYADKGCEVPVVVGERWDRVPWRAHVMLARKLDKQRGAEG